MKSKFSSIANLYEKKVDIARMELEKANKELKKIKDELDSLEKSGNEIVIPSKGSVGMIQYTKLLKDSYRAQLLDLRYKVSFCEQNAYKAKYNVKIAQMEFEKFNHLHTEEVKKKIKRINELEAQELDEIASMRYYETTTQ